MILLGVSISILIIYLLIGAFIGWLAGIIYKGKSLGLLGNIIVGIVGTFIGRVAFWILGFHIHTLFWSLTAAVLGAVLVLYIINLLTK
jgi:uncharacterized membrane protein YeaQ/YmgE (transglycosylase-associated protein family)